MKRTEPSQNAHVPSNKITASIRAVLLPGNSRTDANGSRPADRAQRRARRVVLGVEDVFDREERVEPAHHLAAHRRVPDGVGAENKRWRIEVVVELLAAETHLCGGSEPA